MSTSSRGPSGHRGAATILASAAALAASSEGYADVVYSGLVDLDIPFQLNPLPSVPTPWDVDGDSIVDFNLSNSGISYRASSREIWSVWSISGVQDANRVQTFDSNAWYFYDDYYLGPLGYPNETSFVDQLDQGSVVGSAVDTTRNGAFFVETNMALLNWFGQNGFYDPEGWADAPAGLFGFHFEAADGTHFGWARAELAIEGTPQAPVAVATLVDWAWEDDPDTPIAAGVTLPEPGTGAFLLVGLGAAGIAEHRRRQRVRRLGDGDASA